MAFLYYFVVMQSYKNYLLIAFVGLLYALLIAYVINKIAFEPIESYVQELEHYTKETLHELNIPVNTIQANSAMLQRKCSDAKNLKRLKRIDESCTILQERYQKLSYIINKEKIEDEVFDFQALLERRIENYKLIYPNRSFELHLQKFTLKCDRVNCMQVIDNIVENSVKYSQSGSTITIILDKNGLTIQDEGKGMDEFTLLHIFDRYYQSNEKSQGYGIGLSVVKAFCDKYKLQLSVQSEVNKGTQIGINTKNIEVNDAK